MGTLKLIGPTIKGGYLRWLDSVYLKIVEPVLSVSARTIQPVITAASKTLAI